MKTTSQTLIAAFLCLISCYSNAQGSGADRGGGNALVCFNNKKVADEVRIRHVMDNEHLKNITRIDLIDLLDVKSQIDQNGQPDYITIKSEEDYKVYFARIKKRAEITLPQLASWLNESEELYKNTTKHYANGFEKINDENTPISQTGRCVKITVAAQETVGDLEKLYIYDGIFNHPKFSEESRAILLAHEYIYRVMRRNGDKNAARTRDLVALLFKKHIGEKDAIELLRKILSSTPSIYMHNSTISVEKHQLHQILKSLWYFSSRELSENITKTPDLLEKLMNICKNTDTKTSQLFMACNRLPKNDNLNPFYSQEVLSELYKIRRDKFNQLQNYTLIIDDTIKFLDAVDMIALSISEKQISSLDFYENRYIESLPNWLFNTCAESTPLYNNTQNQILLMLCKGGESAKTIYKLYFKFMYKQVATSFHTISLHDEFFKSVPSFRKFNDIENELSNQRTSNSTIEGYKFTDIISAIYYTNKEFPTE